MKVPTGQVIRKVMVWRSTRHIDGNRTSQITCVKSADASIELEGKDGKPTVAFGKTDGEATRICKELSDLPGVPIKTTTRTTNDSDLFLGDQLPDKRFGALAKASAALTTRSRPGSRPSPAHPSIFKA